MLITLIAYNNSWRRQWQPTPVFLPGESQGWGRLVGCRLWGHTESDPTEAMQQQQQQQQLYPFTPPFVFEQKQKKQKQKKGFPCGSAGKESERPGFGPWVGKIPWRRERLPTPVCWPGEFHEMYSPWGHEESDTTEPLLLHSCLDSLNVSHLLHF